MCWSSDVVSMACAAAVTAGDVAVVSVNVAEREAVDEPEVAPDLVSVAQATDRSAVRTMSERCEWRTESGRWVGEWLLLRAAEISGLSRQAARG
jgi:hypothetical protein